MNPCKFCTLLAQPDLGAALPNLLLPTDRAVAALNRRPIGPGHVTIILKAHHERTGQVVDGDLAGVGDLLGRIAAALEKLYAPGRVVLLGDGKPSAHLHLHLIPEAAGTVLDRGAAVADLNLATRPATLSDVVMAETLRAIRTAMGEGGR